MKKNKVLLSALLVAMTCFAFIFNACNKKFDEPPSYVEVTTDTARMTIEAFKQTAPANGGYSLITSDTAIIKGVVVANDKSGNIYKTLYIQDSTGAIDIEIDGTGLYNSFPIGREVYVHCKGLYLANESGMIKLGLKTVSNGATSLSGIPSAQLKNYVVGGKFNLPVVPKVVTVAGLNNSYQCMLIQLDSFQFATSELFKTYADVSANKSTQNVTIQNNCTSSNSIIIRTSGYSNFAGTRVPQGNGSVVAIYTIFQSGTGTPTKQLIIRDTSDVKFYSERCGSVKQNVVVKPIQEIRALGSGATIPANTAIEGVVVSNTANEAAGNYRIQNEGGQGIQVRFSTGNNGYFLLNDKVKIDISGLSITTFSGDLQINNAATFTVTGTNATITPRITNDTAIISNKNNWSSTVATISNVKISIFSSNAGGTTYKLTDATGSLESYIRTTLGYPNVPATATSVTGYVSVNTNSTTGGTQLIIRTPEDIVGGVGIAVKDTTGQGSGGNPGAGLLVEDFESTTDKATINIANWSNLSEAGTKKFATATFSSNKYAQITAFSSKEASVISWLVTKGVNLNGTANDTLTFDTKTGFDNGATLKVLISTNYTGSGNPWASGVTWTDLTSQAALSSGPASGYATNFTPSGNIILSSFSGTAYIAFKYEGSDVSGATKTTTWQIDNIKISGK